MVVLVQLKENNEYVCTLSSSYKEVVTVLALVAASNSNVHFVPERTHAGPRRNLNPRGLAGTNNNAVLQHTKC